jgi:type III secretion system low calcium response chaperone LcrH/SycD
MPAAAPELDFDISQLNVDNIDDAKFQSVVNQFLTKGATFKQLKGFSEDEMEAVYTVAYNLFQNGKLDDAEKVFRFLCFFDHLSQKYWLGLGACRKALKNFAGAIDCFGLAGMLDLKDPRPALQAAECHIQLGKRDEAISALNAVVGYASENVKYAALVDRAKMMLKVLDQAPAKG